MKMDDFKEQMEVNRRNIAKQIEREMNAKIAVSIVALIGMIGFMVFIVLVVIKLLQFCGVI